MRASTSTLARLRAFYVPAWIESSILQRTIPGKSFRRVRAVMHDFERGQNLT